MGLLSILGVCVAVQPLINLCMTNLQEADEHCLWGYEPLPPEADPEPPLFPPGEGPSGADGARGHPTDLPQRERDESGWTDLRQ